MVLQCFAQLQFVAHLPALRCFVSCEVHCDIGGACWSNLLIPFLFWQTGHDWTVRESVNVCFCHAKLGCIGRWHASPKFPFQSFSPLLEDISNTVPGPLFPELMSWMCFLLAIALAWNRASCMQCKYHFWRRSFRFNACRWSTVLPSSHFQVRPWPFGTFSSGSSFSSWGRDVRPAMGLCAISFDM